MVTVIAGQRIQWVIVPDAALLARSMASLRPHTHLKRLHYHSYLMIKSSVVPREAHGEHLENAKPSWKSVV